MSTLIIFAVVLLAIMLLCGTCTAKFAAQRGRSKAAWFLLGALFFPIPSIVLALLPSDSKDNGSPTPTGAAGSFR